MKNGHCPRCRKTEIFHQPGDQHQSEQVTLSPGLISKAVAPDRYICVACGYVEFYLADPDHLEVVRKAWKRVPA